MKITVIGTGYVGLVSGTCLADVGNDVLCLDLDAAKIGILNQGGIPIYEPGLEAMVKKNVAAGRLRFTTDIQAAVAHGVLQFIAVGTPPDEDGSADLQYVVAAARNIGRHMTDYKVVVDKSTVPVGTADKVRAGIAEELKARGVALDFSVVSNPEFLKEGAAVEDFMKPDRIVVGAEDARAIELMRELYAPFQRNHERLIVMDVKSAELTKYAANAMLATRISFMNELANLAEKLGADIELVRKGIGSDPRIGFHFLYPGVGYGGSCFPKDVQALIRTAQEAGQALQVLQAVEAANDAQKGVLAQKITRRLGAGPERQDLRPVGPGLQAQHRRHARGAEPGADCRPAGARCLDPGLRPGGEPRGPAHPRCQPRASAMPRRRWRRWTGPTPWPSSPSGRNSAAPISMPSRPSLKTPVIFDGRNLYDPATPRKAGLEYFAIGRP
jgi:UDPglucose 6-dehydrogenase